MVIPKPNLAEGWEVSDDGQRWTFYLNQGMEMGDGTPYTSYLVEEVILSELSQRPEYRSSDAEFPRIVAEIIDDYTIMFEFQRPNPGFLEDVSQIEFPR